MPRCINKCDLTIGLFTQNATLALHKTKRLISIMVHSKVLILDSERSNRLSNGTKLLGTLVEGGSELIEQSCLSMVYMAHDSNYWSSHHVLIFDFIAIAITLDELHFDFELNTCQLYCLL